MDVLEVSSSFPPGFAEMNKANGTKFDGDVMRQTRAIFAPAVRQQSTDGVDITADVPFGSDARQTLDLYRPTAKGGPVVIFVPGGGYQNGDKRMDDDFLANIGVYFARHGFLSIVMNYRLAPAAPWPAGAEDVGSVVAWAHKEAADLNADGSRVFLMGQSAGATHVASYVFDPRFHPASGVGVTAAILCSGGGYRVGPNPPSNRIAYFGADESQWDDRSPMTHVNKSDVPLFLSVTEYDPVYVAAPTFDLARAVTVRDKHVPPFAYFRGHNHISTVLSLGSAQDDVGARVRDFMAQF